MSTLFFGNLSFRSEILILQLLIFKRETTLHTRNSRILNLNIANCITSRD